MISFAPQVDQSISVKAGSTVTTLQDALQQAAAVHACHSVSGLEIPAETATCEVTVAAMAMGVMRKLARGPLHFTVCLAA